MKKVLTHSLIVSALMMSGFVSQAQTFSPKERCQKIDEVSLKDGVEKSKKGEELLKFELEEKERIEEIKQKDIELTKKVNAIKREVFRTDGASKLQGAAYQEALKFLINSGKISQQELTKAKGLLK